MDIFEKVVKRLMSGKTELYWWNPLLDDPNVTIVFKKIYKINSYQ